MKDRVMVCPQCSGQLQFNNHDKTLECPYCGYKVKVGDTELWESPEERTARLKAKSQYLYDNTRAYQDAKADSDLRATKMRDRYQRRRSVRKFLMVILIIACLYAIGAATMFGSELAKPCIEDPFDNVKITFAGNDGYGIVKATVDPVLDEDGSEVTLHLSFSKEERLSNGDIVTVSVHNELYRFSPSTLDVKVTGLNQLLNHTEQLTAPILKDLDTQSRTLEYRIMSQPRGYDASYESVMDSVYLVDKGKENRAFVLYRVDFHTKDGCDLSAYWCAMFSNVYAVENPDMYSIVFSSVSYDGHTLTVNGSDTILSDGYIGCITGWVSKEEFVNSFAKDFQNGEAIEVYNVVTE